MGLAIAPMAVDLDAHRGVGLDVSDVVALPTVAGYEPERAVTETSAHWRRARLPGTSAGGLDHRPPWRATGEPGHEPVIPALPGADPWPWRQSLEDGDADDVRERQGADCEEHNNLNHLIDMIIEWLTPCQPAWRGARETASSPPPSNCLQSAASERRRWATSRRWPACSPAGGRSTTTSRRRRPFSMRQ